MNCQQNTSSATKLISITRVTLLKYSYVILIAELFVINTDIRTTSVSKLLIRSYFNKWLGIEDRVAILS